MSTNSCVLNMADLKSVLVNCNNDGADKSLTENGLENLSPVVKKRVESLKQIQNQHDELEGNFLEERAALEAKYEKMYQPLYSKRYDIVNGVVEAEGVAEVRKDGEKDIEKGVPDFWLTAIKNNDIVGEELTERDEGALKYLRDIKYSKLDDEKGFKLDFFFDPNPYFNNTVLTKVYHLIDEEEMILDKVIGTEIEWYPGKCLTKKILKKKPKKGSKDAKPVKKTEKCPSFFNFFDPPKLPKIDVIDQDTAEELQNSMDYDYDIGSTIRDKLIPHAVRWFTGEAEQEYGDFYDDEEVGDINLEGDEEDEDEYEEDEDEDEDGKDEDEDKKLNKEGKLTKHSGDLRGIDKRSGLNSQVSPHK